METLLKVVGNDIISHRAVLTWPRRFPDITAPDYLKDVIFRNLNLFSFSIDVNELF